MSNIPADLKAAYSAAEAAHKKVVASSKAMAAANAGAYDAAVEAHNENRAAWDSTRAVVRSLEQHHSLGYYGGEVVLDDDGEPELDDKGALVRVGPSEGRN